MVLCPDILNQSNTSTEHSRQRIYMQSPQSFETIGKRMQKK